MQHFSYHLLGPYYGHLVDTALSTQHPLSDLTLRHFMKWALLLCLFSMGGNQDLERWSDLLKVTRLVRSGAHVSLQGQSLDH